jgi:hypothetical protein
MALSRDKLCGPSSWWLDESEGQNMKTPNKMMIAVGALALTATALLAGCGGSSTASTAASEPAASESPAPSPAAPESPAPESPAPEPAAAESAASEVPTSLIDGLVQPAGASDDGWATFTGSVAEMDVTFDGETGTPEEYSELCSGDKDGLEQAFFRAHDNEKNAENLAAEYGSGSVEDWSAVIVKMMDNFQRMACSMAK